MPEPMTLSEMEQAIVHLVTELDDLVPDEGVLDDDVTMTARREAIEREVEGLLTKEAGKVDAIAHVLARFEQEAAWCWREADRVRARAKSLENKRERLASYVLDVMLRSGTKRIDGKSHSFTRIQSQGRVEVADPIALPPQFVRTEFVVIPHSPKALEWMKETVEYARAHSEAVEVRETMEPDKLALREALKAGTVVPGASLSPGSWRLAVR